MLDLVKIFEQVVESGSFSQAGQVLNMAPSSVTRNIDKLEHQLETTLFKRSTRQLILTEEGHYFYAQSLKLLEDSEKLIREMKGHRNEPQGVLRISVFESFGNLIIAPLLPQFLKLYPKIQVELDIDNRVVDLNSENIDIAVRIGTPQDSRLKARKLLTNHTSLVATQDYLDQHACITQPDDLTQHNCLLINQERQRYYWYFSQDDTKKKIPVSGNLLSKGGSPLLSAALSGGGVLLLSSWMVEPYLKNKQLVSILPEWQVTHSEKSSGEIFAIYKSSHYPKPNIRAFLDYLIAQINTNTPILG
ncbi:LysR family transcriptional regulator [Vibrio genomosp. F6]|uniref:Transcriptional regulator n=1 Tax=Vibrio genomosp. F6 str. FF-238 TaxID=1191298 RepID=A0A1E5D0Z3_9VIBR|nr:LysR family transcriptional regulator [Vibrio genomosp. F6]OEE76986.1 transcriptional regulator [Vibrio genomosp. F6 str. FF-238]